MAQERVATILEAMDDAWDKENWHLPLWPALEGLDAAGASRQPSPGTFSVAQYVQHVAFWKAAALRRLTDQPPLAEEAGDNALTFGAPTLDEEAWTALRQTLQATQAALRGYATMLTDADLEGEGARVEAILLGVAGHDSYHAGEIALTRKVQGTWPLA